MTVFAVVALGGQALLLAWVVAEATERWSAVPGVRAIAGAALVAAIGALAVAAKVLGKPAEPRDMSGSEDASDRDEPNGLDS
jgi:hypothetical protein